ncbi:MAG: ATP cone domain-containing protein, partial [Thiobacillus sp.]|nr:ATP cone domain-containing protein [Thiobacillus sp.]
MTDVGMGTVVSMAPREVIKRDGQRADFDTGKIRSALLRAGQATAEFDEAEADLLTAQVAKVLIHRFRNAPPDIERIQDVVEQSLIAANHLA